MAEISPNNTGLSGEYFVAEELYRRGWSVGMTVGNTKVIDLFAEKGQSDHFDTGEDYLQAQKRRLANDARQRQERLHNLHEQTILN